MRKGKAKPTEGAPGPSYIPAMHKQADRPRVAELRVSRRIALSDLARIGPELLARIMMDVGALPDPWGECSACRCGAMQLQTRSCQLGNDVQVAGFSIPQMDHPMWRSLNWECQRR
eukprot:5266484-Pyramimonas_sp.AAC.1